MKEIIIRCDHCGNVIDGDPYKVVLQHENRENGFFIDMDPAMEKYQEPVGGNGLVQKLFSEPGKTSSGYIAPVVGHSVPEGSSGIV